MKSIKNYISEYGYLTLLVIPAFFVTSYLFNVIYFHCFDVKISKVPLAISDYTMSINIIGIALLSGFFFQILGVSAGQFFGKKIIKNNSEAPSNFNENASRASNSIEGIKKASLILSVLLLTAFAILVYKQGMIAAQFICFSPLILYIYLKFFIDYDKPSFFVLLAFPMCLVMVLDNAVRTASDDYKNSSIEITTGGNKYFIMRNFENGYWVKSPDTGEILFVTKNNDILNFGIPKDITKYLKSDSNQQPDKKLDIAPQGDGTPAPPIP